MVRTVSGNHSLEWLLAEVEQARQSGKRIVTTNGCFDLIHPGHVNFLNAARDCGDLLIVLLNRDNSVRELKGAARPIVDEEGRAAVLLGLRAVDYVVLFGERLPNEVLALIRPDVHCKAGDYRASELPEASVVEQNGGEVRILPHVGGYSTSLLAARVRANSGDGFEAVQESEDAKEVREDLLAGGRVLLSMSECMTPQLIEVAQIFSRAIMNGHKVLVCGNGGSAADAQHFAAELVGRFRRERTPLAAIALTVDTSILTSVANDYGFEQIFSRQVDGLGMAGDVLVAISTSGNSANVLKAVEAAKTKGITTVGLTGMKDSRISATVDLCLRIPATETPLIQQGHLAALHVLCELVDKEFQRASAGAATV